MKMKFLASSALAIVLLAGCASEKQEQAELQAQAKVTRADAEKTALTKAPNGTIKEGELEKEHGKLIWSFDIATPDSQDITEVAVDAMTGDVVSVGKETPKAQAKEKDEDAKKAGKDKD
jgi:PBP1b-binding outer membrane lipoprotein LpoB